MDFRSRVTCAAIILCLLAGCSSASRSVPQPSPSPERPGVAGPTGVAPALTPAASGSAPAGPYALISRENLLATIRDLTAIQPYSGWRNSGTEGEAEAVDYVAGSLDAMAYLSELGLELERQSFHVFLSTELWESRLLLTIKGQEAEVLASGLRGPRDETVQALRFDSDGRLNDAERNPAVVEGPVSVIRSRQEIEALDPVKVADQVVFLDHRVVDRVLLGIRPAVGVAWELIGKGPAGLVVVTQNSNAKQESHGAFIGDNSAFNWVEAEPKPPILYVRLEDLAPAGISDWDDLSRIERARLVWDADVFSPGTSTNLIARIPGADPSAAVILGAHIDSPNSPGAMDDGSGSAALLEVARVINAAGVQPPADLYLAWFGSEELGLYGSAHFALTHQELLDRTLAMLELDCLTRPLDGIAAEITAVTWSYGRLGDDRTVWPDRVAQASAAHGIRVVPLDIHGIYSDNSTLAGFGVPQADLIYANEPEMEATGSFHYAGHLHDPYDTLELAEEMGDVLERMAQVMLVAALQTDPGDSGLRVSPPPAHRAVLIASHTESIHMAPTAFIDLGMAWTWEGFDVDVIPYGQAVTPADLTGVDLVVVLPVVDYPSPEGDPALYDESFSQAEVEVLEQYVAGGGFLVLTNSANRLKYNNGVLDANEDWSDMNALAEQFGVTYQPGVIRSTEATLLWDHPLAVGKTKLELADHNAVPFDLARGLLLAQADGEPVMALIDHGTAGGQVLVLADVGILGAGSEEPGNLFLWQNLARQAKAP